MQISFYNVRKREIVAVPIENVQLGQYKRIHRNGTVSRYFALKAVDGDGTSLTKFCNHSDWDSLL